MCTRQKELVENILGHSGKMVSASKGRYSWNFPKNFVVFNSNLFTEEGEKIWYGDIDITNDESKLVDLSKALDKKLFVLYESDGRFENENTPKLDQAALVVTPEGATVGGKNADFYERVDGVILMKELEKTPEKELPEYDEAGEYIEEDYNGFGFTMNAFRGDKAESPLDKFYKWVKSIDNRKGLSVTDLYLSVESEDKFKVLIKEWLIEHQDLEEGSYELHKNMCWIPLEMPNCFYKSKKGPRWAKPGHLYIKKEIRGE